MRVLLLQAAEDREEERVEHVDNLMVMLLDRHFQVKPYEFGQMSMGVRVLGAKDWIEADRQQMMLLVDLVNRWRRCDDH